MTRQQAVVRKKRIYAVVAVILAIILLCGISCAVYVSDYYHAEEAAVLAMASDGHITVSEAEDGNLLFLPDNPQSGLIFYPGGKVEYTAYAPLMRACAQRGIFCVLLKMPWNLAVLDVNAADGITQQYPDIDDWYLGGHSLGGAMAANYAANRNNLPADVIEVVIEGGCHAGFGTYGPQSGDGTPSISSKEQIDRTAEEIWNMVQSRE